MFGSNVDTASVDVLHEGLQDGVLDLLQIEHRGGLVGAEGLAEIRAPCRQDRLVTPDFLASFSYQGDIRKLLVINEQLQIAAQKGIRATANGAVS